MLKSKGKTCYATLFNKYSWANRDKNHFIHNKGFFKMLTVLFMIVYLFYIYN